MAKEEEMKELLTTYADGQIDMYRKAMEAFDQLIPKLEEIKTDNWKERELFLRYCQLEMNF